MYNTGIVFKTLNFENYFCNVCYRIRTNKGSQKFMAHQDLFALKCA